jgi:hypothetical protein
MKGVPVDRPQTGAKEINRLFLKIMEFQENLKTRHSTL